MSATGTAPEHAFDKVRSPARRAMEHSKPHLLMKTIICSDRYSQRACFAVMGVSVRESRRVLPIPLSLVFRSHEDHP